MKLLKKWWWVLVLGAAFYWYKKRAPQAVAAYNGVPKYLDPVSKATVTVNREGVVSFDDFSQSLWDKKLT